MRHRHKKGKRTVIQHNDDYSFWRGFRFILTGAGIAILTLNFLDTYYFHRLGASVLYWSMPIGLLLILMPESIYYLSKATSENEKIDRQIFYIASLPISFSFMSGSIETLNRKITFDAKSLIEAYFFLFLGVLLAAVWFMYVGRLIILEWKREKSAVPKEQALPVSISIFSLIVAIFTLLLKK